MLLISYIFIYVYICCNIPAPQGFVSEFKCFTALVMAPTECKTIGFCFVWFCLSVFSVSTVSNHNSIHHHRGLESIYNTHLFELDCGFYGFFSQFF